MHNKNALKIICDQGHLYDMLWTLNPGFLKDRTMGLIKQ